jgi:hypothetical protein
MDKKLNINSCPVPPFNLTDDFCPVQPIQENYKTSNNNTMTEQQAIQIPTLITTDPEPMKTCVDSSSIFSSHDFGKFLNKDFPSSTSPFLSADNSLASFDPSCAFKSKDTFSNLFSSDDWAIDFAKLKPEIPKTPQSMMHPTESSKKPLEAMLTSTDWMPSMNLGPHVDVSFDRGIILSRETSTGTSSLSNPVADLPSIKTEWDRIFMSQLQLMPPQPSPKEEPPQSDDEISLDLDPWTEEALVPVPLDLTQKTSEKKKRKRRPRQKVVPDIKVYVEPTTNDVLLGRGGRSNHHPGNKRYREEVCNLREWYGSIGDNKDDKTKLSQTLVDRIQSNNGRFLEKDKEGWYVVPNVVARRKASQALREDDDPEKRAAKRQRFLAKRAALESDSSLA